MTKIEWTHRPGTTGETWNPVTGCTKISEGCKFCYAERMARRLAGRCGYPEAPKHFDVTLRPDRLEQPLRWRKPRTVFVCSMADLFHHLVPFEFVKEIWTVMAACSQHTFIVLSKRGKLMRQAVTSLANSLGFGVLPNVWGLVTVENQDQLWRVEELLRTPFAVRGVSLEPLLGPVDISDALNGMPEPYGGGHRGYVTHDMAIDAEMPELEGEDLGWQEPDWHQTHPPLDWVIAGGESGPGARPMHPRWPRDLRDQCYAANTPFFFKQRGEWTWWDFGKLIPLAQRRELGDGLTVFRVGKKAAGRLLDGREWNEWPEGRNA